MIYLFNVACASQVNWSHRQGAVRKQYVFSEVRISSGGAGCLHCWVRLHDSADSYTYPDIHTFCYTDPRAVADTHPQSDSRPDGNTHF